MIGTSVNGTPAIITGAAIFLFLFSACGETPNESNDGDVPPDSHQTVSPPKVENISVEDVGDSGNGTDLVVSFDPSSDEAMVLEYRIIVFGLGASEQLGYWDFTLTPHFFAVVPNGGRVTARLPADMTDIDGTPIGFRGDHQLVVVAQPDGTLANVASISDPSLRFVMFDSSGLPRRGCGPYPDQLDSEYVLPFPAGMSFPMLQGNCSPWTLGHSTYFQDGAQRYAYDFTMPLQTPIIAMRDGTVTAANDSHPNWDQEINYVVVRHDDGSHAFYAHLAPRGALADVGDVVQQGDTIALSGGSQSIPGAEHLHVQLNACVPLVACESLPLVFRNTEPHPNGLVDGKIYTAND